MKKNGRTLTEDCSLIKRGMKEFNKILPGQLGRLTAKSILASLTPYISIVLSAMILNELTGKQDKRALLICIFVSTGLTLLFSSAGHVLDMKISTGYSRLFASHEISLTGKSYRIPYELLENEEVRRLREQVSGNISVSGAGMASLYWDIEIIVTNLCSATAAVGLCLHFIWQMVSGVQKGWISCFDVAAIVLLLAVLVAGGSFFSCKMTQKRFDISYEVFKNGAAYNRYGEFYTLNYLPDEDTALDVRMFRQKELILEESQKKCYRPFADGCAREMRSASRFTGVKLLCMGICGMAVYAVVSFLSLRGVIEIGSIVMTYSAVILLIGSLNEMAQIVTDLRNNNIHLLHYFSYMDLDEAENQAGKQAGQTGGIYSMDPAADEIRFEHVCFHYPGSEQPILQNVSFTVASGEKLAIVGENGSGKTTLIKLLCRLYRPSSGQILLNGRDIWEYSYEEYIRHISAVFQDFSLFSFSLAENVAASNQYDAQKVYAALCRAGLKEKTDRLAKGLEQPLFHDYEADGTGLSGGEAQKTAIARAIYKASPVVILDEPTAALDPFAEKEIYGQFFRYLPAGTILSISHRLSSCRFCDRIAVMDAGHLVELGTHEELLKHTDGKYLQLWEAQAQYYS